eukprot:Hpha_TRINITY_DN15463_c2_g9::TRINITY_DN15463_c2_g9_i1::g.175428::m.175428/K19191/mabO; 4-methylaminobutanoate oxidase (formaldehyde-forming)
MGATTFQELLKETGQDTGFKQCGSLTVARTDDRVTLLKRNLVRAQAYGVPAEIVDMDRAMELFPVMNRDTFKCGLWLPNDGTASPTDATMAYAKGAKQRGAQLIQGVSVTGFELGGGEVVGVKTDRGDISCKYVVNCAGLWAHELGKMAGVSVPLHPCEHFYVVTGPIEGVTHKLPVVRDPDRWAYYREWSGGLVLGGFETKAKPCFLNGPPEKFEFSLLEDDYEHFYPVIEAAFEAIPALQDTPIQNMVNGPESFTPDNQYILGEAPECRNFWVCAGMNSSGIASSAGAGWALAQWLANKRQPFDLNAVDIRRFGGFAGSHHWVRERSSETLGMHYRIPYPRLELQEGRPLRRSASYERLKAGGAVFGSKFGWERANYFAESDEERPAEDGEGTFGVARWQAAVDREYAHTTSQASIFDVTSFSKFTVQGKGAESLVNHVFGGDMSGPIGQTVYTALVNERGGYESDCTVTRVGAEEWYVVSPTAHGTRDLQFLRQHARKLGGLATVTDVSSAFNVFSVQGPRALEVLSKVSRELTNAGSLEAFPKNTSRMIDLGHFWVRAMRVSYVGEDGLELHVATECAAGLYDTIMEAGEGVLKNGGYYCVEAMRVARGYRAWGHEMTTDDTPVEAGTGFAVAKNKPPSDFIAGNILQEQKAGGLGKLPKRVVSFVVEDPAPTLWGGEALVRNGEIVGFASSGVRVQPLQRSAGMAMVKNPEGVSAAWLKGGEWQVNVAGELFPATVGFKAPIDLARLA